MDLEEETRQNKLNDLATLLGSQQKLMEYQGLTDDADRVQAFMRSPAISVLLKTKDGGCKDAKSVAEAKRYKELGNQAFKRGLDEKAMYMYTESAAYAPNPSFENSKNNKSKNKEDNSLLAVALANRSAALLRLGRVEDALADVESAISVGGHPRPEKLSERRESCLSEIQYQGQVGDDLGPSLPNCGLSQALDIIFHPERGRYAVANTDIRIGDVVLVEDPAVSVIKKAEDCKERCAKCLKHCGGWQVVCQGCSSVRFCSSQCQNEALGTFHRYECSAIVGGQSSDAMDRVLNRLHGSASDYCTLSLRAISQKSLSYFMENEDETVDHKFGIVSGNRKKELKEHCFQKEPYLGLTSLVSHNEDEAKSAVESLWVVASACFTLRRLQLAGFFGDKIRKRCQDFNSNLSEEERTVARAAANFLRIMRYNTHSVEETTIGRGETYNFNPLKKSSGVRMVASAIFPTLALLNHSCDHNITKYYLRDGRVVAVAARDIPEGEEVTENYYPHFAYMKRHDRRQWLKSHYNFDCNCVACSDEEKDVCLTDLSSFKLEKLEELSLLFEKEIKDKTELENLLKTFEKEFGVVWRESASIGDPSRRRRMVYPWLETYARIIKLVRGTKKILKQ